MSPSNRLMQNARDRLLPATVLVISTAVALGVACGTGARTDEDASAGIGERTTSPTNTTGPDTLTSEPVPTAAPTYPPPTPLYPTPVPTLAASDSSPTCLGATSTQPAIQSESGIPITTTTLVAPGCRATTPTLPPGKVHCTIFYGTIVEGMEKDLPVYRADTYEQIATIHVPGWTWTPAEAEEICA